MSRGATWRIIGVALVLFTSLAVADSPFDPGNGQDASNLESAPTILPAFGAYHGHLPLGDQDWYGVDTVAAPACIVGTAVATAGFDFTLATRGQSPHGITTPVPPNLETRLAVAGPAMTRAVAGIARGTAAAQYDFTLTRYGLDDFTGGDGGSSGDAPALLGSAVPVPGPCFRGSVGLKDSADVYSFRVGMGDQVIYSLAAPGTSSPSLQVLDAAGSVLGAIGSGGIGSVTVPSTGTYYLAVSVPLDSSGSNYLVGLVGPDPPPGSPCRPHCALS